jgi:hypothetical protein
MYNYETAIDNIVEMLDFIDNFPCSPLVPVFRNAIREILTQYYPCIILQDSRLTFIENKEYLP